MADDTTSAKKGRGGFRERAGRPKGSKNKPKSKPTVSAPSAPPPPPLPTSLSSTLPQSTAKRKAPTKLLTGFKTAMRGIANFWQTSAPQGNDEMDAESNPDDSTNVPAHNAIARIHEDLHAADTPKLVSERIYNEVLDNQEEGDDGAALLDDENDGGDEDDEDGLEAEQDEAEVAVDSVNEQWLQSTLEKLKKETADNHSPQVYRDEQLWIYPKDPIFALRKAATTEIYAPDALYRLPIFVWLPDYLPGRPDHFTCECGEFLNKHSWNTKPIARRVCTTSGSDYFLLTKRHYCPHREGNTRGCGKTYQGSDPWILGQLPKFVQDRFPVVISHRSAIDRSQMDMMKIMFAGRFGPDPFSKMVRELKYLQHSRLESMYLHAALHYGLRGPRIPPFSPFRDALGFAGYAPSTKYLKSIFIAWFSSCRLYMDRIMSSLSATIIKADHTFKTVDHQGRLPGGEPIHTALYDAVNTDEEVRFYGLTLTQGFAPLEEMYDRLKNELPRHGHKPTELLYCDNPRAERAWHERITPSLKHNVEHIIIDPFRDLPAFATSMEPVYASSPDRIDTLCDEIIRSLPPSDSIYLALSLELENNHIRTILIRTQSRILVLDAVLLLRPPPSLISVLTHPRIVKFGHGITVSTQRLMSTWTITIPSSTLVDLGKLAKLKGVATDPNCSLPTLCGAVLKQRLDQPLPPPTSRTAELAAQVDCAWSIQCSLMMLGSVGILLQPAQLRAGQPVALVISNKTLAWGELASHNGQLVVPNTVGVVKVTKMYSVIKLIKLFVPGYIIAKHHQTLEWLSINGGYAVVQTRTLHSRAVDPPHPATEPSSDPDLGIPAPITIPSVAEQLASEAPTRRDEVLAAIENEQMVVEHVEEEDTDNDDLMGSLPEVTADNLEQMLRDSIQHAQDIINQPHTSQTLASRILDDAYHFMDRLLRLLSKKHPAFKEFAHLFSETIFIRDAEDEAKVRAILAKKGISWEYAIRARKAALHRRIRRYIPSPEKLVRDLLVLFACFQDVRDADGKPFFSKDAQKQAAALIETARLGFLSDLPGLALYYWIGRDKDGLNLYRTVRGTNSVEGGVHKQIRRIFGSLHASLALTEAILANWFMRRNRRIGHYNRTGTRWNNHFDIWLLDDIVETAIRLEVKPTFPEPKLLATRIATSETFGIIPITAAIANEHEIPILPPVNVLAASHHNDTPSFALTQLSTKPVNLYRYLQTRQRTTAAVVPVHTRREFEFFIENIASFIPSNTPTSPEQIYKATDYAALAKFWNRRVVTQPPTELAAEKRLYFKLPEQLERHHKKSLQWKMTRATLHLGENVTALQPIHELLSDPARKAVVLPAIMHEPTDLDFTKSQVSVHALAFNPTVMRARSSVQHTIVDAIAAMPTMEPPTVDAHEPEPPLELHQTVLAFESPPPLDDDYDWMEEARLTKKARTEVKAASSAPVKRQKRRCAPCAAARCGYEYNCRGKGRGREGCEHFMRADHRELGTDAATRKRYRARRA
ncbi:hypothetical protein MIND_00397600 [Mycena indigotica]|uniref:DUF6729 domain-containing protein n=1 Tax=Mycena indigotica TaxID=2126181 RepID=A0A8H6WF74_9AGAR|nr:uncharacterized protein MIND_00397600 [Mycena indigotica]KAF7310239.1 hypothetical protein MIND_00397600 [Mycena indigotica]